jgi:hypothetical protein
LEYYALAESVWPDFESLVETDAPILSERYKEAPPFPHLFIDNLFPENVTRAMANEFETVGSSQWRNFQGGLQRKRGTVPGAALPPTVQEYFNLLYSGPFIRYLSRISGIEDLIPDPALFGGGMHEVSAGGSFEVHLDFTKHPRTGLTNRLVVITYLNDNWTAKDGGALELWELNPPHCANVVNPVFGRTVIMEQSKRAAHGHPQLVREGRLRRSVIAYFYTNAPAAKTSGDMLNTTYIAHSGHSRRQQLECYIRRLAPQLVIRAIKRLNAAVQILTKKLFVE